jgi:hypothetical protein
MIRDARLDLEGVLRASLSDIVLMLPSLLIYIAAIHLQLQLLLREHWQSSTVTARPSSRLDITPFCCRWCVGEKLLEAEVSFDESDPRTPILWTSRAIPIEVDS